MITQRQKKWLLLPVFLILSGCLGSTSIKQKYYLLEPPAQTDWVFPTNGHQTDVSCLISEVRIAPAFAGTRIAVRTDTHELKYYGYHKWAMRPATSLTQIIESYFRNKKIFNHAAGRDLGGMPEYELRTQVNHLEVIYEKNDLSAHLNIEFNLIKASSGESKAVHAADNRIRLKENDLNLFAAAIGKLIYQELNTFSQKIITYLATAHPDTTS